ncbi:hypothetical protein LWI29_004953 [Acer saccharum]|uniref:Uncharacterized protein n=1 Tax=Acer saccharum TaxID=4024 RepID=A0AA39RQM1_ACESA|nr:hypothetical protein LWI29_004953 [Acer saccharum]
MGNSNKEVARKEDEVVQSKGKGEKELEKEGDVELGTTLGFRLHLHGFFPSYGAKLRGLGAFTPCPNSGDIREITNTSLNCAF